MKGDRLTGALAAGATKLPEDLRVFVPDTDRDGAYPIVTYTWLLLYGQYPNARRMSALKDFVRWGLSEGQQHAEDLGYLPLPAEVASRTQAVVAAIE